MIRVLRVKGSTCPQSPLTSRLTGNCRVTACPAVQFSERSHARLAVGCDPITSAQEAVCAAVPPLPAGPEGTSLCPRVDSALAPTFPNTSPVSEAGSAGEEGGSIPAPNPVQAPVVHHSSVPSLAPRPALQGPRPPLFPSARPRPQNRAKHLENFRFGLAKQLPLPLVSSHLRNQKFHGGISQRKVSSLQREFYCSLRPQLLPSLSAQVGTPSVVEMLA